MRFLVIEAHDREGRLKRLRSYSKRHAAHAKDLEEPYRKALNKVSDMSAKHGFGSPKVQHADDAQRRVSGQKDMHQFKAKRAHVMARQYKPGNVKSKQKRSREKAKFDLSYTRKKHAKWRKDPPKSGSSIKVVGDAPWANKIRKDLGRGKTEAHDRSGRMKRIVKHARRQDRMVGKTMRQQHDIEGEVVRRLKSKTPMGAPVMNQLRGRLSGAKDQVSAHSKTSTKAWKLALRRNAKARGTHDSSGKPKPSSRVARLARIQAYGKEQAGKAKVGGKKGLGHYNKSQHATWLAQHKGGNKAAKSELDRAKKYKRQDRDRGVSEAVDPEERKLRLRKVAQYAKRNWKAHEIAYKSLPMKKAKPGYMRELPDKSTHHELRSKHARAIVNAYRPDPAHPSGSQKMWKRLSRDYGRTRRRFVKKKGYDKPKTEAHDRAGRVARLKAHAKKTAQAAAYAYKHNAPGTTDTFVKLGAKAKRSHAVATRFKPTKVDPKLRRQRLSKVLRTARAGFAKVRSDPKAKGTYGKHGPYQKASKALSIYQRKRYQHRKDTEKSLVKGGIVTRPSERRRGVKWKVKSVTGDFKKPGSLKTTYKTGHQDQEQHRRKTPWHVQPADKPKPHLQRKPSHAAHPVHGMVHAMKQRGASDDEISRRGYNPKLPKLKDKSGLPKYATTKPGKRKIKNPVIRRATAARGERGTAISAQSQVKRDIGRREKRTTSRFVRGHDRKEEAVDPEERKLRLKKIRAYADRQRKAAGMAQAEYSKKKDPKVGALADKHSNRYLHADQLVKHKSGRSSGPGRRPGDSESKRALDYFRKLKRKTESSRHRKAVTRAKLAAATKSLRTTNLHLGGGGRGRDQQDNYTIHAHDKAGNSRGHLSYSNFRGKAHINMVKVPKALQGRGIGKKLLRRLHKDYRPSEVNPGYSTSAGSKLLKSYKKKYPDG